VLRQNGGVLRCEKLGECNDRNWTNPRGVLYSRDILPGVEVEVAYKFNTSNNENEMRIRNLSVRFKLRSGGTVQPEIFFFKWFPLCNLLLQFAGPIISATLLAALIHGSEKPCSSNFFLDFDGQICQSTTIGTAILAFHLVIDAIFTICWGVLHLHTVQKWNDTDLMKMIAVACVVCIVLYIIFGVLILYSIPGFDVDDTIRINVAACVIGLSLLMGIITGFLFICTAFPMFSLLKDIITLFQHYRQ